MPEVVTKDGVSRVVVTRDVVHVVSSGKQGLAGPPGTVTGGISAEVIHSASGKTAIVDADEFPAIDSENSFGLIKVTWAAIKLRLKAYFDGLYSATGHGHDTAYEPKNANIQAHIASAGNPHGTTAAQVGADPAGTAADALTNHEAASNPHPQYLTQAEGDGRYEAAGAAAGAVNAHAAAADPHPQYLTQTEGDGRYDPAGTAAGAVSAHEAASDPHPQYLTATEGGAAYEAKNANIQAHIGILGGNPHGTTAAQVGADPAGTAASAVSAHAGGTGVHSIAGVTGLQTALDARIQATEKGAAGGVVPLDGSAKIASAYLPSYVDDVVEAANFAALPGTGEAGKIYVTLDSNKTYRWSGSAYVEISASPGSTDAVTEGATNLYFTNARASAAAPVQSVAGKTGNVTLVKGDVGLSNVDNTSDANKPVSTAQQNALDGKFDKSGGAISGNVGLGVPPSAWASWWKALDILGGTFASSDVVATSVFGHNYYFNGSNYVYKANGPATMFSQGGGQHQWHTAPSGTAGGAITFTQAMTLDASGNLLVGATSGTRHTLSKNNHFDWSAEVVNTSTGAPYGLLVSFYNKTGGAGGTFISCQDDLERFKVLGTGNVQNTNNSYGAISDLKLKENITDATPKLESLCRVRVVNYNLKSDPDHKQLGVIAQELEEIFPGMVEETPDYEEVTKTREIEVPAVTEQRLVSEAVLNEDGEEIEPAVYETVEVEPATTRTEEYTERVPTGTVTKSVKYSVFVPMLIKAVQELNAKVAALESA